jgi:hypothetical protein
MNHHESDFALVSGAHDLITDLLINVLLHSSILLIRFVKVKDTHLTLLIKTGPHPQTNGQ